MKTLIVITGPTACGKTAVSVDLAKKLQTEIVSCDSRQFYKELAIGTAKPSIEEMDGVTHHFVDSHSVTEEINAGKFERLALPVIKTLFETHDYVILTGGSGLFIDAITKGFDDMPTISEETRNRLRNEFETEGLPPLVSRLKSLDPEYANEVDLANPQRVIRALEILESSDKTYTELRQGQKEKRPFQIQKFVLDWPREVLYGRINKRVDLMMHAGLEKEVKSVSSYKSINSLNTVGYKEMFAYLDGETDLNTAIELIKRNSRRYAKRQLTWFRRDDSYQWIDASQPQQIFESIKKAN